MYSETANSLNTDQLKGFGHLSIDWKIGNPIEFGHFIILEIMTENLSN